MFIGGGQKNLVLGLETRTHAGKGGALSDEFDRQD